MRMFFPFLRRLAACLLCGGLLAACHPFGLDHPFGQPRRPLDGANRPGRRPAGTGPAVWLTAVEFPASYDWERDTAYGTAACRLVLFSGKDRVLTLDAGPEFEISPDPDMHRASGGHLYTDYATDTETVIRRDGVELFRYPGREAIRGFLVIDGHIHTLGEDRSGEGFAYRIDGEVVLDRPSGVLLPGGAPAAAGCRTRVQDGPLYVEGGQVCFSYCEPGPAPFLVRDGVAEPVQTAPATAEVMDQRLYEGVLYRVERRSGASGRPFLVSGESSVQLAGEPRLAPVARKCTLVPFGGEMAVRGWYHYPDGPDEFLLWTRSGILYSEVLPLRAFSVLAPAASPSSIASSGPGTMAYVLSPPDGLVIGKDAQTWTPIGRYRLYTPACACLVPDVGESGTRYYVALSGPSCILWADGVVTPIPIHGYISGLTVGN